MSEDMAGAFLNHAMKIQCAKKKMQMKTKFIKRTVSVIMLMMLLSSLGILGAAAAEDRTEETKGCEHMQLRLIRTRYDYEIYSPWRHRKQVVKEYQCNACGAHLEVLGEGGTESHSLSHSGGCDGITTTETTSCPLCGYLYVNSYACKGRQCIYCVPAQSIDGEKKDHCCGNHE